MRLRLLVILAALTCALCAPASAAAEFKSYPWPVRPFNREHPVRANFGDPRTEFAVSLFENGIEGPGAFSFHNGIDIAAPDGTAVYPVMSGTVKLLSDDGISVSTGRGRVFQYFHIVPVVMEGQYVVARKTVIGHIRKTYGHVHLTEIRNERVWNPLAAGGIAPYHDTLRPHIASIQFRPPAASPFAEVEPLGICGTVSIVADAFDTPQLRVPGAFAGFPVSPAVVSWTLRKFGGAVVQQETTAADFRTTLPPIGNFWDVYARGTYQNAPRFANRQFSLMPGRYIFQLAPSLDTRILANGVYIVTVKAADIRGNAATASQRFTVANRAGTETGCPAAQPRTP